jgi:hypothetical protein
VGKRAHSDACVIDRFWLCLDDEFFLNVIVALFAVIWQLVSNHGLIRLKRFVS